MARAFAGGGDHLHTSVCANAPRPRLRNIDTAAGVRSVVHLATTSPTKRLATLIAAVLVLFVTALPAAAVCCLGKPSGKIASMHASMPCCAEQCTMSSPNSSRDRDVTLTPAPPAPSAAATVGAVVTPTPATAVASAIPANEHTADELSPPPLFLVNSQFRI